MAAGVMFKLGEPITCNDPCAHKDCAANRAQAALPCHLCGKAIRPGERYYVLQTLAFRVALQQHAEHGA